MKLRRATTLVALIAASAACKSKTEPAPAPAATHVTPPGREGSTSSRGAGSAQGSAQGSGSAQDSSADPWSKPTAALDPISHPLFWSIEKEGKTTYFLGTMHLGVDAETRLPRIVWNKLDAAKTFAMETDLSDPKLAQDMAERHDGGTLHKDLGDAYWKKLEQALTPPLAAKLDHMKPMVPATLLSMRGLPATPAMDGVLSAHASNEHKPIVFLEAASKEAAILEKWMDARALKEMLDDVDSAEQHSKDMLAAYIAGDDQKILALSEQERDEFIKHGRTAKQYEEQMTDLLYARNASWIAPIEALHAAGGGFVAVGAMHLVGKRSVLDLLAQKGYKVTRITP